MWQWNVTVLFLNLGIKRRWKFDDWRCLEEFVLEWAFNVNILEVFGSKRTQLYGLWNTVQYLIGIQRITLHQTCATPLVWTPCECEVADDCIPKALFYRELDAAHGTWGRHRKRVNDLLKTTLISCGFPRDTRGTQRLWHRMRVPREEVWRSAGEATEGYPASIKRWHLRASCLRRTLYIANRLAPSQLNANYSLRSKSVLHTADSINRRVWLHVKVTLGRQCDMNVKGNKLAASNLLHT